jgi:hypothetical protein
MMQRTSRLVLTVVTALQLGTGAARADLGPFPRHRDRPVSESCSVLPIRSVENVTVSIVPSLRVVARGTASTAGWTDPKLRLVRETGAGTPDLTRVYEFVACRPVIAAQVLTPITAEAMLPETRDGGWRTPIVVKAERNSKTFNPRGVPGL